MEVDFNKNDTLIAKGAAIILMYIHHLYAFENRIIAGNYYNSIFQIWGKNIELWIGIFGKICVCIFMFLSGFGTYKSFIRNNYTFDFIKIKIQRFYIIYWTVFLIFIPIGYIIGYPRNLSFLELLNNISCYKITYNGEWWFATPFICMMILCPIIIKCFEKNNSNNFILECFLIVTFAVAIRTILPNIIKLDYFNEFEKSSYWRILYSTIKLIPGFLSGYICAKYNLFNRFREKFKSKVVLLSYSFIILLIVFYCRSKTGMSINWDYIYAPLIILAVTNIIREIKIIREIFISIGKKSTYMWLMHSFFCYQYFQSFIYSMHNSILVLLCLLLVTYLIACILNKLNNFISIITKKYLY